MNKLSLRETTFSSLNLLGSMLPTSIDLSGCTYRRLLVTDGCQLLERQKPYDRQPYEQLERVYRGEGQDEFADDVFYKRKRREGLQIAWKHVHRWLPQGSLWVLAGYGVRIWQVVAWIAAVLLLGACLFIKPGSVLPGKEAPTYINCNETHPCVLRPLQAWAVSVRIFLPVDIPSARYWEPSEKPISAWVPWLTFSGYASLQHLFGWILVPVLVGTLTGYFQRRL